MEHEKLRVAVIGCGRMGQIYAEAYATYPDTEIVAIAEHNADRLRVVGERFGVSALYRDADALLREVTPDIASVVLPTRYIKDAVVACAEAGVRGVSAEKPIAATLSAADEMVDACRERGVVLGGGNLQRAMPEVQQAARMLHSGDLGAVRGACVHRYGGEISGGGCQHISVLRLLTDADVQEVVAWGGPQAALESDADTGLMIHGRFRLTSGIECPVFGGETPCRGVDVWTGESLVRWDWDPPEIYRGFDIEGSRIRIDPAYDPYAWSEFGYLTGALRSLITAVKGEGELWVSGHDLRQALEVAIASKLSARLGNVPVTLPLEDRSLSLLPSEYRWLGGDATGDPQSLDEAAGKHA
jgi:predicted dehydrogenase